MQWARNVAVVGEWKCKKDFGRETYRKETTLKTYAKMEG
jgi:hypothetical protein